MINLRLLVKTSVAVWAKSNEILKRVVVGFRPWSDMRNFGCSRTARGDCAAVASLDQHGTFYGVVPENVPGLLFALTLAAKNNVRTPEELQECLTKMSEVVEAVWSMKGPPQEVDFVPYGKAVIMVNKAIGE